MSICQSAGLTNVTRVELSRRLLIQVHKYTDAHNLGAIPQAAMLHKGTTGSILTFLSLSLASLQPKDGQSETVLDGEVERLVSSLYDSMTECVYTHPISSFTVATKPQEVFEVDILEKGRAALETANDELGKYTC